MRRTLLKSKIHRAAVTRCELNGQGACAIDEDLRDAANLLIIAAFAQVGEQAVAGFAPKLLFVNPDNRVHEKRSTIAAQRR